MKYSFDDLFIVPQFSDIASRRDVDVSQEINGLFIPFPLISAPMDTVTGVAMAKTISNFGGIGLLHRFCTIEQNIELWELSTRDNLNPQLIGCSFGLKDYNRVKALYERGCRIFCLDIAYSYTQQAFECMREVLTNYPEVLLISGSIATKEASEAIAIEFGDKVLCRVGIAGGSACETDVATGVSYPQMSAILECTSKNPQIIGDGGIRTSGDFCKALGGGSKLVMLGGMLSGTDESPGAVLTENGKKYKIYRGMASHSVNKEIYGKMPDWKTAEGITAKVPYKGSVIDVFSNLNGGLRSSMTYVGAKNLEEFRAKVVFSQRTLSAAMMGKAHIQQI